MEAVTPTLLMYTEKLSETPTPPHTHHSCPQELCHFSVGRVVAWRESAPPHKAIRESNTGTIGPDSLAFHQFVEKERGAQLHGGHGAEDSNKYSSSSSSNAARPVHLSTMPHKR